jgi:hypothetical protein
MENLHVTETESAEQEGSVISSLTEAAVEAVLGPKPPVEVDKHSGTHMGFHTASEDSVGYTVM